MENTWRVEYHIEGEERKRLVKAVAEFRQSFSEYCGAPSFAYTVDEITIDKMGTLIFPTEADAEELSELTAYLEEKGFHIGSDRAPAAETQDAPAKETDAAAEETVEEEAPAESEDDTLTIEMPRDGFTDTALTNLQRMVDSKASLLKKSIGTEDLTIEVTEDKIRFSWFKTTDPMKVQTYMKLIAAICKAAKEAKRVTAVDREVDSEKYAFRTWLLRLGFIGAEYKNDRAILMANLSGTAAFKNAADAQAFADKQKAKRDAAKAAMIEMMKKEKAEETAQEQEVVSDEIPA